MDKSEDLSKNIQSISNIKREEDKNRGLDYN